MKAWETFAVEGWIAVIGWAISVLLLVLVIGLWVQLRKLRRSLANMTAGASGASLEQVLTDIQANLGRLKNGVDRHGERLDEVEKRLAAMKGHVAIHRYNAFGGNGGGSDLSFSLAIVDEARNGAVLTAIHGREETFVYGKPVTGGESAYKLTPEEREALDMAAGGGKGSSGR